MPKPVADSCSCDHKSDSCCGLASGPSCFEKQVGEEAATPGQPARARAQFLEVSPRQSAFENHRLPPACRNHPASSGTLTFRWSQSLLVRPREQRKKLSPLCRTCGGSEFPVDERGKLRINPAHVGTETLVYPRNAVQRLICRLVRSATQRFERNFSHHMGSK